MKSMLQGIARIIATQPHDANANTALMHVHHDASPPNSAHLRTGIVRIQPRSCPSPCFVCMCYFRPISYCEHTYQPSITVYTLLQDLSFERLSTRPISTRGFEILGFYRFFLGR